MRNGGFLRVFFVALAVFMSPMKAMAVSGTLNLTFNVVDTRKNIYFDIYGLSAVTGRRQNLGRARPTDQQVKKPLRDAFVKVVIRQSQTSQSYIEVCGKTNSSGFVSIPWNNGASTVGPILPAAYTYTVSAADAGNCGANMAFGVVGGNLGSATTGMYGKIGYGRELPAMTGTLTRTIDLAATDATNAYLTMIEVLDMWDNQGAPYVNSSVGMRADMTGMKLYINIGAPLTASAAVAWDRVLLYPGNPTEKPFTVAHEMGHALAWKSLGLPAAPIQAPMEYKQCDNEASWGSGTLECERVAFAEGFADANASLWMWTRAAVPRYADLRYGRPRTPRNYDLEERQDCRRTSGHRRMKCISKALWDLVDDPPDDDDNWHNYDLSDLVGTLRGYNQWCPPPLDDSRCSWEGYPWAPLAHWPDYNALNWWDFREQLIDRNKSVPAYLSTLELPVNLSLERSDHD